VLPCRPKREFKWIESVLANDVMVDNLYQPLSNQDQIALLVKSSEVLRFDEPAD
jgi:hypothetical protein